MAQSREQGRAVVNTTMNPGFCKRRRISWQDERLSASERGLSCNYVFLDAATLTEVFPCFFLGCKANARVILAKTGHVPHSSKIVVLFYVLFVLYRSMYCLCVNVYCHRVTTHCS